MSLCCVVQRVGSRNCLTLLKFALVNASGERGLWGVRAKVSTEFIDVLSFLRSQVGDLRRLLGTSRVLSDLVEARGLSDVGREWIRAIGGLLGLDCAVVIASSILAIVDKIAVSNRLLKALTNFRREATAVLLSLAGARTGARRQRVRVILMQAATLCGRRYEQIVRQSGFSSFS